MGPLTGLMLGLGAFLNPQGLQFKIFSDHATRVEVCLYTQPKNQPAVTCAPLRRGPTGIWELTLSETQLSKLKISPQAPIFYGYRMWGPNWSYSPQWQPGSELGFLTDVDQGGHRFNPNKLLLDPYAREVSHGFEEFSDLTEFHSGPHKRAIDTAAQAPKGIAMAAPARSPSPLTTAFKDEIIYEVHVRGFTKNDPALPTEARGTYRGAAMKAAYLKALGVTAVEFLPLHAKVSTRNEPNYWGYMTLNFFAPERSYAADQRPGGPTREFRAMVDEFHRHGLKVYVDVVFNHTGEGGVTKGAKEEAPILSFRGIDNATYYSLVGRDCGVYVDHSGCGNVVATARPPVANLVVDSLKYWKEILGVDGFRFDLAPPLGDTSAEEEFRFEPGAPQSVLQRATTELPARPTQGGLGVDLIAEPWAVGAGTYRLGKFLHPWAEWNGYFRDIIRKFMNKRGLETISVGHLANVISGSDQIFDRHQRLPSQSVNFITAHDGFTLHDLFTYNAKQNQLPAPFGPSDGGEDNNHSWDRGGSPEQQRQALRTAFLLLALATGTPMINGGDEFARTLHGNNNPYNLDNEANHLNWEQVANHSHLMAFVRFLLHFRHQHAALRPSDFFSGRDHNGNGLKDLTWYGREGQEMKAADFERVDEDFLAWRIDASEFGEQDVRSIYVAFNVGPQAADHQLPPPAPGHVWLRVADTAAWFESLSNFHAPGTETPLTTPHYQLKSHCALLLTESRR